MVSLSIQFRMPRRVKHSCCSYIYIYYKHVNPSSLPDTFSRQFALFHPSIRSQVLYILYNDLPVLSHVKSTTVRPHHFCVSTTPHPSLRFHGLKYRAHFTLFSACRSSGASTHGNFPAGALSVHGTRNAKKGTTASRRTWITND